MLTTASPSAPSVGSRPAPWTLRAYLYEKSPGVNVLVFASCFDSAVIVLAQHGHTPKPGQMRGVTLPTGPRMFNGTVLRQTV